MPYLNKRNRFIQAAKTHAESNGIKADEFKKSDLLAVANSINMKGIPKECKSSVSHRAYDMTMLFNSTTASV